MHDQHLADAAQARIGASASTACGADPLAVVYALLSQPARLTAPAELRADPERVPRGPGVYGWWFDQAPPMVPLAGTLEQDGWRWLYVGKAPPWPACGPDLRDQLQAQVRGPVGAALLRLTLAVLRAVARPAPCDETGEPSKYLCGHLLMSAILFGAVARSNSAHGAPSPSDP